MDVSREHRQMSWQGVPSPGGHSARKKLPQIGLDNPEKSAILNGRRRIHGVSIAIFSFSITTRGPAVYSINYSTFKHCIDALACNWVSTDGGFPECKVYFNNDKMYLRRNTRNCDACIYIDNLIPDKSQSNSISGFYNLDISTAHSYLKCVNNLLISVDWIAKVFCSPSSNEPAARMENKVIRRCVLDRDVLERFMTATASLPLMNDLYTCNILLSTPSEDKLRIVLSNDRVAIEANPPFKPMSNNQWSCFVHPEFYLFVLHFLRQFKHCQNVYISSSEDNSSVIVSGSVKECSKGEPEVKFMITGKVQSEPSNSEIVVHKELLYDKPDSEITVSAPDLIRALSSFKSLPGRKELRIHYRPGIPYIAFIPNTGQADVQQVAVPVFAVSGDEMKVFTYVPMLNKYVFRIYQSLNPKTCTIAVSRKNAALKLIFDGIKLGIRAAVR